MEPGFECGSWRGQIHVPATTDTASLWLAQWGMVLSPAALPQPGACRGCSPIQSAPWAGLILTCLSSLKDRPESSGQAPERRGLGWVSGKPWQAPGSGLLGPQVGSWEWWGLRAPTCSLVKSLCQGLVFHLHQSTLKYPPDFLSSQPAPTQTHTHTHSLTHSLLP